jgi:hypothetical protein
MTQPTTKPAVPKQAAGAKATPHTTHTGQGKEGGASQSDQWPEHTESIPAQHTTHNEQIDRGGTENRDAEEDGGKKQRTPASSRQEERRGSQDNDRADFRADQAFSQIKSDRDLSSTAKYLCLMLVMFMMDQDGETSLTKAALAEVTGTHRDTVHKAINELLDKGWITSEKRRDENGRLITFWIWNRYAD